MIVVYSREKIVCHLSTITSRTTLHQTEPPSPWQVSNIISVIHCLLSIFKNLQESEMMPRIYPTKTSQNILAFKGVVIGLKLLETDLVNTVWLINLTSLTSVGS
jgi:hypothetical protein